MIFVIMGLMIAVILLSLKVWVQSHDIELQKNAIEYWKSSNKINLNIQSSLNNLALIAYKKMGLIPGYEEMANKDAEYHEKYQLKIDEELSKFKT